MNRAASEQERDRNVRVSSVKNVGKSSYERCTKDQPKKSSLIRATSTKSRKNACERRPIPTWRSTSLEDVTKKKVPTNRMPINKRRTNADLVPSPTLSPETQDAIENAEKIMNQAQCQLMEIAMQKCAYKSTRRTRKSYPSEPPFDDEQEERLYVRELVSYKFDEVKRENDTKNRFPRANNRPAIAAKLVELSGPRFKTSVEHPAKKYGFLFGESIAKRTESQGENTRLQVQKGPSIKINGKLTKQRLDDVNISPSSPLIRGNANVGTYEFSYNSLAKGVPTANSTDDRLAQESREKVDSCPLMIDVNVNDEKRTEFPDERSLKDGKKSDHVSELDKEKKEVKESSSSFKSGFQEQGAEEPQKIKEISKKEQLSNVVQQNFEKVLEKYHEKNVIDRKAEKEEVNVCSSTDSKEPDLTDSFEQDDTADVDFEQLELNKLSFDAFDEILSAYDNMIDRITEGNSRMDDVLLKLRRCYPEDTLDQEISSSKCDRPIEMNFFQCKEKEINSIPSTGVSSLVSLSKESLIQQSKRKENATESESSSKHSDINEEKVDETRKQYSKIDVIYKKNGCSSSSSKTQIHDSSTSNETTEGKGVIEEQKNEKIQERKNTSISLTSQTRNKMEIHDSSISNETAKVRKMIEEQKNQEVQEEKVNSKSLTSQKKSSNSKFNIGNKYEKQLLNKSTQYELHFHSQKNPKQLNDYSKNSNSDGATVDEVSKIESDKEEIIVSLGKSQSSSIAKENIHQSIHENTNINEVLDVKQQGSSELNSIKTENVTDKITVNQNITDISTKQENMNNIETNEAVLNLGSDRSEKQLSNCSQRCGHSKISETSNVSHKTSTTLSNKNKKNYSNSSNNSGKKTQEYLGNILKYDNGSLIAKHQEEMLYLPDAVDSKKCVILETASPSYCDRKKNYSSGSTSNSSFDTETPKMRSFSGSSHSEGELFMPSSCSYSLGEVRIFKKIDTSSTTDHETAVLFTRSMLTSLNENSNVSVSVAIP